MSQKASEPSPGTFMGNLSFGMLYLVGLCLLVIPPAGILALIWTYRAHKNYRRSFLTEAQIAQGMHR